MQQQLAGKKSHLPMMGGWRSAAVAVENASSTPASEQQKEEEW